MEMDEGGRRKWTFVFLNKDVNLFKAKLKDRA